MKAVEYPDCFRYCEKKVVPAGIAVLLSTILWRCAYLPVSIEARLGEHNAVVTNAFLKWTPSRASESRTGVCRKLCPLRNPSAS